MPQADDTQKPQRAQLKHLLIDVHFFNLPKVRALGKRFGSAGKLSLVEAYCQMSCATMGVISLDAFSCIAEDNGIELEKVNEFLDYCLKNNLIIEELGGYSNSRVIKDQEAYGKKLDKDRKRKDSSGKPPESGPGPAAPDIDYDFDIDPDLPIKNSAPPGVPIPVKFLDYVYFDEIQLSQWRTTLDNDVFTRCCEKLNGWIGQSKGDPVEFPRRVKIGKNASAAFQNWVVEKVTNEKKTGPPDNHNKNLKKALELGKKYKQVTL